MMPVGVEDPAGLAEDLNRMDPEEAESMLSSFRTAYSLLNDLKGI